MDDIYKITILTTTAGSEIVAYYLQEFTANCVSIFDEKDLDESDGDYFEEGLRSTYGDAVRIVGFCDKKIIETVRLKLYDMVSLLKNTMPESGELTFTIQKTQPFDWLTSWQKSFEPLKIGEIVICPIWKDYEGDCPDVIKLNSGIGFGTGYHETTSLCILLMQQIDIKNKSVLDAGCGSGILGITALKLGAKKALLVDLDVQAVQATQQNIDTNNMTDISKVVHGDITKKFEEKFDVCLANLTADILANCVKNLANSLNSGGYAILSGILNDRVEEIKSIYTLHGFEIVSQTQQGEWSALLLLFK